MSFPAIAGTPTTKVDTASTTSHVINIPTGAAVGEWLLVVITCTLSCTTPTGWTRVVNLTMTANFLQAYVRVVDGTEGSTLSIASSSATAIAAMVRISGSDTGTTPVAATANSTTGNADPPSLTPAGGAKDYLWVETAARNANVTWTPSTNYSEDVDTGNATASKALGISHRQLNAASEDPGTYNPSATGIWGAATIAFYPVPAAGAFNSGWATGATKMIGGAF